MRRMDDKHDDAQVAVHITGQMPFKYLQEFLQAIRDFEDRDCAHAEDCTFHIFFEAPSIPTDAIKTVMESIRPPFSSGVQVFPR